MSTTVQFDLNFEQRKQLVDLCRLYAHSEDMGIPQMLQAVASIFGGTADDPPQAAQPAIQWIESYQEATKDKQEKPPVCIPFLVHLIPFN